MSAGFISRLSKREKTVLYISILFISLAFLDRAIIGSILHKIRYLDEKIKAEADQIKKNTKIISQRARIEGEEKKYAPFSGQARSDEEEAATLLRELENLASVSSVYLVDLKPAAVQSGGPVKRYVVSLSCEGQMEQLISFLYAVENSKHLLQIGAFYLSPKSKQSSVIKCDLLIYKIVIL